MQLHNMGLAQLYADNLQDSLTYTLLAFLEDVQSKADERRDPGAALQAPAAHNLLFVYAVPGPMIAALASQSVKWSLDVTPSTPTEGARLRTRSRHPHSARSSRKTGVGSRARNSSLEEPQ